MEKPPVVHKQQHPNVCGEDVAVRVREVHRRRDMEMEEGKASVSAAGCVSTVGTAARGGGSGGRRQDSWQA